MLETKLGIIGGSGLYQMNDLKVLDRLTIQTPFGEPSDELVIGEIMGVRVAFLPRHGVGHRIPPSEINFRANIFSLKKLGVKKVISVSAVGSMKEELKPGHIAIPYQFFDRTHRRISTFFTDGVVGHVAFADPICKELVKHVVKAGRDSGAQIHEGGTYICIEGPQFSSRAESLVYRSWGMDVIGMTNVTEAKLAREASLCYATVALVTDYDCWHEEEEDVTVEAVLEIMHKNVKLAQEIIKKAVVQLGDERKCSCGKAAKNAIITAPSRIPDRLKKDYEILFGSFE